MIFHEYFWYGFSSSPFLQKQSHIHYTQKASLSVVKHLCGLPFVSFGFTSIEIASILFLVSLQVLFFTFSGHFLFHQLNFLESELISIPFSPLSNRQLGKNYKWMFLVMKSWLKKHFHELILHLSFRKSRLLL